MEISAVSILSQITQGSEEREANLFRSLRCGQNSVLMISFEIPYVYNSSCVPVDPAWNWYCNSVSMHLLLYSVLWVSLHKWVGLICIPIVTALQLCGVRLPPPNFWRRQSYWRYKEPSVRYQQACALWQRMGQLCSVTCPALTALLAARSSLCHPDHTERGHQGCDSLHQLVKDTESWLG